MTDARFPGRWLTDRRFTRLAQREPVAYVSYCFALMWAVENRTDGLIEPDDLPMIPNFAPGAVKVLVAAGLWTVISHGWLITDFMLTQTSKSELETLENMRGRERRKQARRRAAKAIEKAAGESDVPGDGTGGLSPPTAQDRTGQDRTGKDRKNATSNTNCHRTGNPSASSAASLRRTGGIRIVVKTRRVWSRREPRNRRGD